VVLPHRPLDQMGDVTEGVVGDQTTQRQGVVGGQSFALARDALADLRLHGIARAAGDTDVQIPDGQQRRARDNRQGTHHGADQPGPQPGALRRSKGAEVFFHAEGARRRGRGRGCACFGLHPEGRGKT
jgi:hypothetical protein